MKKLIAFLAMFIIAAPVLAVLVDGAVSSGFARGGNLHNLH